MSDKRNGVKSVSIKNFRCFEDFHGEFEKLTSIVGENGCGKTAVLEAVNFAMSPLGSTSFHLSDFHNSERQPIQIEVSTTEPFTVQVEDYFKNRRDISCDRIQLKVSWRKAASPGRALSDEFTVSRYALPVDGAYTEVEAGVWEAERATPGSKPLRFGIRDLGLDSEFFKGFPSVFYFGKNREFQSRPDYKTTMSRIVGEYNWRFRNQVDGDTTAAMVEDWSQLYAAAVGAVGDKKHEAIMGDFVKQASAVLGTDYAGLELASFNILAPFEDAELIQRNGAHQLKLPALGSGISMILILLLLENVSRLGEKKQSLVFLIDEPEMHLHPQLQERLRDHLADIPHQVIYTTHSPLMVDLGKWRSIRRVDQERHFLPTEASLQQTLPDENGLPCPISGWLDDMTTTRRKHILSLLRENSELLFAQKCVLVEGATDKYCLKVIPEVTGHDLCGLTPIVCIGKGNIPDYQLLCRVFGVPYFTMHDEDDLTKPKNVELNERIDGLAAAGSLAVLKPDLSAILGISKNADGKAALTIQALEDCADENVDAQVRQLLDDLQEFCKTEPAPVAKAAADGDVESPGED